MEQIEVGDIIKVVREVKNCTDVYYYVGDIGIVLHKDEYDNFYVDFSGNPKVQMDGRWWINTTAIERVSKAAKTMQDIPFQTFVVNGLEWTLEARLLAYLVYTNNGKLTIPKEFNTVTIGLMIQPKDDGSYELSIEPNTE